jgi:hypothetical protein
MSWNEWFLSSVARLLSAINTLTVLYFTYSWYNMFSILVHNLVTAEFLFFFESRFTGYAQNVLHLNVHSGTRLIMDCGTVSKVPGAIANGWTSIKNGLVKGLFIFSWSWIRYGVLSDHTDENLTSLRSGERAYLEIWVLADTYWYVRFSLFNVGSSHLNCPSVLDTPCVTRKGAKYVVWSNELKTLIGSPWRWLWDQTYHVRIIITVSCSKIVDMTLCALTDTSVSDEPARVCVR